MSQSEDADWGSVMQSWQARMLVYEERRAGMEGRPVPESEVGFRHARPTNLPCTSPNGATALVARLRLLERRPSRYALWENRSIRESILEL